MKLVAIQWFENIGKVQVTKVNLSYASSMPRDQGVVLAYILVEI